jgi:hypothetical protein
MEHIFGGDTSARIKEDETGIAAPHAAPNETQQERQEEKTIVEGQEINREKDY